MYRTLTSIPSRTDKLGITLSVLCMLHCAAVPVLAVVMPLAGMAPVSESTDTAIHVLVLTATIPVTVRSVARASRSGNWRAARALIAGLTAFAVAALSHTFGHDFSHDLSHDLSQAVETGLSIAGGLALLYGHTARCACVGTSAPSSSTC